MKLRLLLAAALIGSSLFAIGASTETPAAPSATPAVPPAPFMPAEPASSVLAPASPPAVTAPAPASPPAVGANPEPPAPEAGAATPAQPAPPASIAAPAKPKPKKAAAPRPSPETALSDDPRPTLQPNTFFATAKASERYAAIADAGGWPTDIVPLRPGAKGPAVARLRKRLAIEGDLNPSRSYAQTWDPELTAAVERFQARMGLKQTGTVSGATLKAMNVPARARFNQLASSANRLAGLNFPFGDRYVVVNLPSLSVEAVENDLVARRYLAIVGDPAHPSPEIAAQIQVVNLNPTWTVPVSIIKKEIIPRMQRDPGYLTREKIRILDNSGREVDPRSVNWSTERAANYTLRQDSGAGNSLGSIRIGMPNKLAVYMHDTPSKRLFGADYRFLSHGCVRVQGVYDLAEQLLQGTPGPDGPWTKAAMEARVKEGAPYDIKLARPTPVIWVYLTGWSNSGDGPANFRDDVYGLDTVGDAQANAAGAPLQLQGQVR